MDDTTYNTLRLIVYIVGIPIIIALLVSIARRVRAIHELDRQLREEEAQQAKDPYAQMAALYEQEEARDRLNKARRGKIK